MFASILASLLLSLTITTATVAERSDNSLISERTSASQSRDAFGAHLSQLVQGDGLPYRLFVIDALNGTQEAVAQVTYMASQL